MSVKVARLPARRDGRLPEREALVVPELLDVFQAADTDELQALGRPHREQDVGEMVGLVAGEGEGNDEREARHALSSAALSQNEIAGLVR